MTVKELKERLEVLIEDGKGHYSVFVGDTINDPIISIYDPIITITDYFEEVNISAND